MTLDDENRTTEREMPDSVLNGVLLCTRRSSRLAGRLLPMSGYSFKVPWATKGIDTGRNAEAVGDNFWTGLDVVALETKGSFSAVPEAVS